MMNEEGTVCAYHAYSVEKYACNPEPDRMVIGPLAPQHIAPSMWSMYSIYGGMWSMLFRHA
jgi:hypothetical protein